MLPDEAGEGRDGHGAFGIASMMMVAMMVGWRATG